jgi:asparagine synthetase B (glutamine-hydrolysing)
MDDAVAGISRADRLVEGTTGVALVQPFFDSEIIQIASSIPWDLRQGPEGGRMLLRRAMRGILPEEIRLRTTKCHFSSFFASYFANSLETSAFQEGGRRLEFLLNRPWESINRSSIRKMPYSLIVPIFRVGLIGAWLRQQGLSR